MDCNDTGDVPKGDRYVNRDVVGDRSAANADISLSCPSPQLRAAKCPLPKLGPALDLLNTPAL